MLGVNLNSSSIATYDHLTQTIHLKRAEEPDLVRLAEAVNSPGWDAGLVLVEGAYNVLAPLAHETRHWLDMNCSIRGLRTLKAIFDLQANPVAGTPPIRALKQDITLNHFIERYEHRDLTARYPWQVDFRLSVPRIHEQIEHISLCFYGAQDRDRSSILFKSPIYLGSLLETCAVYQEQRDVLPLFLREGLPHGARSEAEAKALGFLKDPTAPEYHAITHAVSIAARQPEAVHGIALAAGLCTLLLNMPAQMLKESCRHIEDGLGSRSYGKGLVSAADQMRRMAGVCPEAAIIHTAVGELARRSAAGASPYSTDLIFDLLPFWRKSQEEFFERSHADFVTQISLIKGPGYFHDAAPALIQNNQWLMEQKSLALTLGGLPNRPPIIFGDGFVLKGADAFEGLVPNFENADNSAAEALMNIQKLCPEGT
ncbi:hypothetical protein [Pseudomonas coronafaciens]|uniref:hypothetical protein n=1 Tax=Pseudomonas coronafaciens TaxID=53409 RepID=UPI0006D650BB|nr:hypothetical protein [Pseudomonas coronafaciens]